MAQEDIASLDVLTSLSSFLVFASRTSLGECCKFLYKCAVWVINVSPVRSLTWFLQYPLVTPNAPHLSHPESEIRYRPVGFFWFLPEFRILHSWFLAIFPDFSDFAPSDWSRCGLVNMASFSTIERVAGTTFLINDREKNMGWDRSLNPLSWVGPKSVDEPFHLQDSILGCVLSHCFPRWQIHVATTDFLNQTFSDQRQVVFNMYFRNSLSESQILSLRQDSWCLNAWHIWLTDHLIDSYVDTNFQGLENHNSLYVFVNFT